MSNFEFYILIPWAILIPYGILLLLKRNYRINSGLCPKCGSKIDNNVTSNYYNTDKTLLEIKCEECKLKENNKSIIKIIFSIIFLLWMFGSLIIFRGISLNQ